ncbi:MAG TPA: hypothetical protein PLE33_06005 [Candidatus Cloacimonas sp.]|nr:hypothetical protein [Candidatus Cloacimonas sp.]HPS60799.1 hypothetical protein [Candidatus Cloacimonas sp.]
MSNFYSEEECPNCKKKTQFVNNDQGSHYTYTCCECKKTFSTLPKFSYEETEEERIESLSVRRCPCHIVPVLPDEEKSTEELRSEQLKEIEQENINACQQREEFEQYE